MLKIGTKLGLGIGVLLTLCVIIGLVSYTQTNTVREKLEEVTQIREPANSAVYALENRLVESAFAAFSYSSTDSLDATKAGIDALLESPGNARSDPTQRVLQSTSRLSGPVRASLQRVEKAASEHILLRMHLLRTMDTLHQHLGALDRLLTERIERSVREDDPVAYRRLQVVLGMQVQINAITKHLGSYLLTGDKLFVTSIRRADMQFREFLRAYRVLLLRREERAWSAELQPRAAQALGYVSKVLSLEQQRREQRASFLTLYRDTRLLLNEGLQSQTERALARAKNELIDAGRDANRTILAALVLSMLVGFGVGYVTTRNITKPLEQLTAVMQTTTSGRVAQKVSIATHDEFRLLGNAFNEMTDRIEKAEQERTESLRLFAVSMQRAQEEERSRIARELHDDLCQRLTGTKYQVEVLHDQLLPANKRMAKELDDVMGELDRSIAEVRRISFNLRPSVLDDFGLVAALRLLCTEFQRAHGIPATVEVADSLGDDIGTDTEIALYRIAQEALHNIGKHAGASKVRILLTRGEAFLRLRVEDDGKGFEQEDVAKKRGPGHGLGLISMRERAELLGGVCEVTSAPGTGTAVMIAIPWGGEVTDAKNQNSHSRRS